MSRTTLSRRARTTGALTLALAAAWPVADRAAAAPVALTGLQYECAVLDPEDPEAEPLPLADRWVLDLTADLPATVQQGSTMPAPAITTKITVGDDAADLLREGGVTTADAGGSLHLYTVGSTELLAITDLDGSVRLPRDGAATVRTTGEGEELKVTQRPGTLTVAVGPMLVSLGKEGDVGMDVACEPVAGQRLTLGRITVVAAPTPTPTPTPTSTPTATPAPTSTPVPTTPAPAPTGPVVQADWVPTAQDEHRHGRDEQLLLAGAALAAAGGGGALVRRRRSDHTG